MRSSTTSCWRISTTIGWSTRSGLRWGLRRSSLRMISSAWIARTSGQRCTASTKISNFVTIAPKNTTRVELWATISCRNLIRLIRFRCVKSTARNTNITAWSVRSIYAITVCRRAARMAATNIQLLRSMLSMRKNMAKMILLLLGLRKK